MNPSDQHNTFTTEYVINNIDWCKSSISGRWGCSSGTHKFHLSNAKSRRPDISFWGYPRCSKKPGTGILTPTNLGKGPIPDVVIQFSWKNKKSYKEDAIDDMMNLGLEHDHGAPSTVRPRLGYLIKVRFSRKQKLPASVKDSETKTRYIGLDIFRLTHGTTIRDAQVANNPNANHWRYVPGGTEIFITFSPQDLGITGFWALLCGEYKIKASDLFQEIRDEHTNRQSSGLTRR